MSIPTAALLGSGGGGGGGGSVNSVTGTAPITVDNTDPANPIVGIGAGLVNSVTGTAPITVNNSDPDNPVVGLSAGVGTLKVRLAASTNTGRTGLAAIDGVTPVAGDRILCLNETAPANNGIYVAAAGAWSRATDFDVAGEMIPGVLVSVTEGTVYAASAWMFSTTAAITVGVTALAFALVGPSFGADVQLQVANSTPALVDALRLILGLAVATPGGEYSRWDWNMLVAGAVAPAYGFQSNAFFAPELIFFLADIDTGFSHNGADACKIVCGGNQIINFAGTGAELAAGTALRMSGSGAQIGRDGGTGTISVVPDTAAGNVQLGQQSLANTATHGFPCVPAGAGAPTGVVTGIPAGMAAIWVDTTNGHIYWTTGGGTWVDSSV